MVVVADVEEGVIKTGSSLPASIRRNTRMAVVTDTIEGVTGTGVWFHYDLVRDVLYLRQPESRDERTYAEENEEGILILRREDDERVVGLTSVNWWKQYGSGSLPDSLRGIEQSIEPWAKRLPSHPTS
jgi:hypothetical protein